MGDLVDRLRKLTDRIEADGPSGVPLIGPLTAAANEIERLRFSAPALPSCAQPTEYRLSLLPEDFPQRRHWDVSVRHVRRGDWIVTWSTEVLDAEGVWGYPPPSSEMDIGWWESHSWPLDEALRRAEAALPTVEVMGKTAANVLAASESASLSKRHRDTGAGR